MVLSAIAGLCAYLARTFSQGMPSDLLFSGGIVLLFLCVMLTMTFFDDRND
ncbi:hypothetical protein [Uliginosibacterium sp. H1]|uniref:hypothetical protein n=1 Tax=Uliginosibacterium sp. H1 TaxID=3114757 RepID=UPI002E1977C6|nr:hypothetical protein [Uliginosibacterium sp. H1]